MRLLGVEAGDEVFVPSLTFIASANPIVYEHATLVFLDSERATWNLDPALVVEELERRNRLRIAMPKALEVVHVLGRPANIEPLVDVCQRFGVRLLEDAAEALGARYVSGRFAGKQVGTVGEIGCFSFNGNKVITAGGGGMIVTDNAVLARRAKHLTTQARLPGAEYRHDEVGYNYRLTNVAAAIGLAQLECLPDFLRKKAEIAKRYDLGLAKASQFIPLQKDPEWSAPSHWLYTRLVADGARACRDREISKLAAVRAEARPIWTPLHEMSMFRHYPRIGGSVAEDLSAHGLSFPSSVGMTVEDQDRVIAAVVG
jgi:dTDP-4-amino-4,6-dideoxygalactose transaminase